MQITLLSHFVNEEILLPSWLTHHKKLFTHGIMLNCGSVDRSCQIIKEICPTWEIIDLSHEFITSPIVDIEVIQGLEAKLSGWKCALNVSEYLVVDNLEQYLTKFELEYPDEVGFRTTGIIIIDRPNENGTNYNGPNIPNTTNIEQFLNPNLMTKKDFGYLEAGKAWIGEMYNYAFPTHDMTYRNRLVHKTNNGEYTNGRHNTRLPVKIRDDIFVSWIGRGSPELYHARALAWNRHWCTLHGCRYDNISQQFCQSFWLSELKKSENLFELVPKYKEYIDKLYSNE